MCHMIPEAKQQFPNTAVWIEEQMPRIPDLEAQVDAIVRQTGVARQSVRREFGPAQFGLLVDVADAFPAKARNDSRIVLRFRIDRKIVQIFESDPNKTANVRLLNAALIVGITQRLVPPGRFTDLHQLENEVFGEVLEIPKPPPGKYLQPRPMSGTPLAGEDLEGVAGILGINKNHILAVIEVEGRAGFFSDRRPSILFERHKFSKYSEGRFDSSHPSISSPRSGGYNEGTQYQRFGLAHELDPTAALKSCSWGVGQVMGFNFHIGGFASVEHMVSDMMEGEGQQLHLMAQFIQHTGLADELRSQEWASFARIYNGPNFRANDYDTKLKLAFERANVNRGPDIGLRRDQLFLSYLGFNPGPIDGIDGQKTQAAVKRFQRRFRDEGLTANGKRNDKTIELLAKKSSDLVESQDLRLL